MLIGIDASRANVKHKSGTEWYAYYVIRWLAKLDDKNQYILYSDKPLRGGLQDLRTYQHYGERNKPVYDKEGYQEIKSPFNNFRAKILKWPFENFWTLGRLSWEFLGRRPDVLFMPTHTLSLIHPRKTLITIHDMGFTQYQELYKKEKIGPRGFWWRLLNALVFVFSLGKYRAYTTDYLFWSTRHALKRAQKVIAVSETLKQDILSATALKPEKVQVILNGYNTRIYQKISDEEKISSVLGKYGIERPYLFYVGRLDKRKNIPALIEAFAIMKSRNKELRHKLVLVGDAFFGYDEINYMIEEFGLSEDVVLPGWVEELDVPALYSGAEVFVFPSLYEGFGIQLLQAMSCQVPIAASNIPVMKEIAQDAALYFDPSLRFKIAEALQEICTNKELRETLKSRGLERVKNFSWQKTAQETLNIINRL